MFSLWLPLSMAKPTHGRHSCIIMSLVPLMVIGRFRHSTRAEKLSSARTGRAGRNRSQKTNPRTKCISALNPWLGILLVTKPRLEKSGMRTQAVPLHCQESESCSTFRWPNLDRREKGLLVVTRTIISSSISCCTFGFPNLSSFLDYEFGLYLEDLHPQKSLLLSWNTFPVRICVHTHTHLHPHCWLMVWISSQELWHWLS
jgi:hypothetical protein